MQDRAFQIETLRRLAYGRLAEILGEQAVELDMWFRILGMGKKIESIYSQMSDEMKRICKAYSDGVNFYLSQHKGNLPLEFRSLNLAPEPYQPKDALAVIVINSWLLNTNFDQEILAVKLLGKIPMSAFDDIFPSQPGTTFPQETYLKDIEGLRIAPFLPAVDTLKITPGASNNWVISGTLTQSGYPYLANDPHLSHSVPEIWYFCSLHSPELNVSGSTIPGAPMVAAGYTGTSGSTSVSFGITNLMADYSDLFIIELKQDMPKHYLVDGQTYKMEEEEVIIKVKGKDDVHRYIYHTIYGPIITDVTASGYQAQVALKWHQKTEDHTLEAFYKINKAKCVKDVLDAGRLMGIIALNIVVSDAEGNIGYHAAGRVPIRKNYTGRLPAFGSNKFVWDGFIPYDDLPSVYNPATGIIVTANNFQACEKTITYAWAPPYRYDRIVELLSHKDKLTIEDLKKVQNDVYSLQARKLIPILNSIPVQSPDARWAQGVLADWDKEVKADSLGAAVYEVWLTELSRCILVDELGENIGDYFAISYAYSMVDEILQRPNSVLYDKVNTEIRETIPEIIEESLIKTVEKLSRILGNNRNKWRYGNIHKISYNHPAAKGWLASRLLNAGTFPLNGYNNTVCVAGFNPARDQYSVIRIPSMRFIIDMGDVNSSLIIGPMGQSGQPQHKHYKNMIPLWLNNQYIPIYFERAKLEKVCRDLLILKP